MVIGLLTARVSIPESHSLKDKRSVLRSLKDRIVGQMNVSVAEIGEQDLWQSAELAFVTVAATKEVVERRIAEIRDFLVCTPRWVLLDTEMHLM
ncbi:MAG: DUF503 domain-containing protein [Lentisphaerae bacterium]|nr:DUF503 domain-containing protein [Lentisphaerota bacterium]